MPVAGIIRIPNVMVINPSVPAATVPEFIAYSKANPTKVNMASAGIGSGGHLCGELFKMLAGVTLTHVPFRGNGPALTALLGGQVEVLFASLSSSLEYIRTGKVRALAITSAKRSEAQPDLPTIAEFVPGYDMSAWYGASVPKGTSAEVIDRLNAEINAGLADPKTMARLAEQGGISIAGTPADFGKYIADETEKWGKVVRFAGMKPE
jgi:tripartite-type tricarboxylate transporter receptor subunit TctC